MNNNTKIPTNVVLESSQPVFDGGRKYNFLYAVCPIVIGIICAASMGGVAGFFMGAFLGLIVGWVVKNILCRFRCYDIRSMTFQCENQIPYGDLIQRLQPVLMPLGMSLEITKNGIPTIKYKSVYYDVVYNADRAFSINWHMSILGSMLTRNEYIIQYRKACVAYGIIGYYVQQACRMQNNYQATPVQEQQNQPMMPANSSANVTTGFCKNCGKPRMAEATFCKYCGIRF